MIRTKRIGEEITKTVIMAAIGAAKAFVIEWIRKAMRRRTWRDVIVDAMKEAVKMVIITVATTVAKRITGFFI